MARTHESVHALIKFREYCVETIQGELVGYFTWKELRRYCEGVSVSALNAHVHQFDNALIMGKYIVTPVEYVDECLLTPKGIVRLP